MSNTTTKANRWPTPEKRIPRQPVRDIADIYSAGHHPKGLPIIDVTKLLKKEGSTSK